MDDPHRHGRAPWNVVLVHGGPGACGEVAPLAEALAPWFGVAEPWLTATTIEGQCAEVETAFAAGPNAQMVLIGHSWGAWIATLVAARRPERVAGLVWIGCPPFSAAEAASIEATRLSRLDAAERAELAAAWARLEEPVVDPTTLGRVLRLLGRTDAWDLVDDRTEERIEFHPEVLRAVWPQGEALRASGGLRAALARVVCPVVAFHGEHDPHPIVAIAAAGAGLTGGFRLHRFARCGHVPWRERAVRDRFLAELRAEIDRLIAAAPV